MLGLLLPVERVESPRWTVGEQWRELLRLKLLLDAVKLTAAGGHCRERQRETKVSFPPPKSLKSRVQISKDNLLISPLHCQVILL